MNKLIQTIKLRRLKTEINKEGIEKNALYIINKN